MTENFGSASPPGAAAQSFPARGAPHFDAPKLVLAPADQRQQSMPCGVLQN